MSLLVAEDGLRLVDRTSFGGSCPPTATSLKCPPPEMREPGDTTARGREKPLIGFHSRE